MTPGVLFFSGAPALTTLHQETRSLPIVFVLVSDPVKLGFVASLARPGGNVQEFANFEHPIVGKLLDLLKDKADPPRDLPSNFKKFHREAMSHELGLPKRREFRLELAESRRIVPEWTSIRTLGHRRGSRGAMRLLPRDRGGRAGVPQGGPADCGRVP